MSRRGPGGVRATIDRLDVHLLHQRAYMQAADIIAFSIQQPLKHPAPGILPCSKAESHLSQLFRFPEPPLCSIYHIHQADAAVARHPYHAFEIAPIVLSRTAPASLLGGERRTGHRLFIVRQSDQLAQACLQMEAKPDSAVNLCPRTLVRAGIILLSKRQYFSGIIMSLQSS